MEKRKRPEEDDKGTVAQKSQVDRTNPTVWRRDQDAKEGKCSSLLCFVFFILVFGFCFEQVKKGNSNHGKFKTWRCSHKKSSTDIPLLYSCLPYNHSFILFSLSPFKPSTSFFTSLLVNLLSVSFTSLLLSAFSPNKEMKGSLQYAITR